MSDATRPFSAFVREHRRLRERLERRLRPLDDAIRKLRTLADIEEFTNHVLPPLIDEAQVAPPRLGSGTAAPAGEPWPRRQPDGSRPTVTEHSIVFAVEGDADTLLWWPDDVGDLSAVEELPSPAAALTVDNFDDAWRLDEGTALRGPELRLSVLLTPEEESAGLDVRGILVARKNQVDPIIRAIQEQITAFNASVRARVDRLLDAKRTDFEARESVTRSLALPGDWLSEPPALEEAHDASPPSTVAPAARSVDGDVSHDETEAEPATLHDVHVAMTPRLAPRSFEQIQRIIRVWADAVERYPKAFAALGEDRVSDLLAATLNATLPGAGREVYSRSGKSDILVRADVLHEGSGPENVLIIESKWANSEKIVQEALDPQLFGYLKTTDTAAVLLLLLRQKDFNAKRTVVRRQLRGVAGFTGEEESAVTGWPIFRYRNRGRLVRVCVATIHLDRPRP